jgi:polyisoprenoid-binding protein YceI
MIRHSFIFTIAVCILSLSGLQAQILTFDHGKVEFYTTTIMSDIDAVSEDVFVNLDAKTGEFEVEIEISSFEFEYELMQEHFNEKYMESDKFPKAVFKGSIAQNILEITDEKEVDASGKMSIHGVEKELSVNVSISKKENLTLLKCKFPIVFKDYNVDEPSILTKKFAKDVEVKCTLYLK